jgi:organic hydroperoxide reductase OsmC/OhrA
VARKRKITLADLSVRVVGEYGGAKFVKVRIEVNCDHPREELEMLAQRASAICYVSNTIRALQDTEVVIT